MAEPVFVIKEGYFAYPHGPAVFQGLDLIIRRGESVVLLGANGSGKSTLLRILAGLQFVSKGDFWAFGDLVTERKMNEDAFAKAYHRRVGFLFQNTEAQLFTTRVWDEIAFGPLQLAYSREEVKKRVEDVLNLVGIGHLRDRSPHQLSGGEKKKLAMATMLVMNPEVFLLDEPTNGLDPRSQTWLVRLLLELNRHGRTLVIATHNLALAHTLSKRAVVLSEEHRIVYDGNVDLALADEALLRRANLMDEFAHLHDGEIHTHRYTHG